MLRSLALLGAALATAPAFAEDIVPAGAIELSMSPDVKARNMPFAATARPSDQSQLITLTDGARIAVYLHWPVGYSDRGTYPAVHIETMYGHREEITSQAIDLWRQAGFVVVVSDVRGFAASFGNQRWDGSTDRPDQNEILGWITDQPWSNGTVAAAGLSISATYADKLAANRGVKAAVIRAFDRDHYSDNMFPGGVPNLRIVTLVQELAMWHGGGPCLENQASCGEIGFQPVDGDADFALLHGAILDHQKNGSTDAFPLLVFRDDAVGAGTLATFSSVSATAAIRAARVPARVSASWVDGTTAESAIARFNAMPEVPMEVVIGTTTHTGGLNADPFAETPFLAPYPGAAAQFQGDVDFVKRVMGGERIGRSIRYTVMGLGVAKTTPVWPPKGVGSLRYELAPDEALATGKPAAGSVGYTVDPESSLGPLDRWASQRGSPIHYGDLRNAAGTRLTFTGPPIESDMELVGAPELCLALATDQTDGTVIAYLEDVAPNGRVTYLTEGVLRLIQRKTEGAPCDPAPGAKRSFKRADFAAVSPGETMLVELPLYNTAAYIKVGHRLRLQLAGFDNGTFDGLTGDNLANWTVQLGGESGSYLTVPLRPWGAR